MQVETANRSLEEMDAMFAEGPTRWPFSDKDLSRVKPIRSEEYQRRVSEAVSLAKEKSSHVDSA